MLYKVKSEMKWKLVMAAILLHVIMLVCANAYAVPAEPGVHEFLQSDGTMFNATIHGDELFNWSEDENGYVIAFDTQDQNWHYAKIEEDEIIPDTEIVGQECNFNMQSVDRITSDDLYPLIEDAVLTNPFITDTGVDIQDGPVLRSQIAPKINQQLLLLLIEFNDVQLVKTEQYWSNKYFTGDKSVAGYYRDMSNGLDVFVPAITQNIGLSSPVNANVIYQGNDSVINSIPWVSDGVDVTISSTYNGVIKVKFDMVHPIPEYDKSCSKYSRAMITMALKAIRENTNFDFSGFGSNKQVAAIVAGGEASAGYVPSTGGQVWAHKWIFDGRVIGLSGNSVYMHHGEMYNNKKAMGIGVSCHELGHTLGLPDLYNTLNGTGGICYYSVMASGSWGAKYGEVAGETPVALDAWSKCKLGYIEPVLYESSDFDITSVHSSGVIGQGAGNPYNVLQLNNTNIDPGQFFLVENRQNIGWDAGMQKQFGSSFSGGIVILQIDDSVPDNRNNSHRKVDIVGSSGNLANNKYFYTANGNRKSMTTATVPNSNFHSQAGYIPRSRDVASNISIKTISTCSNSMTVEVGMDTDITSEFEDNHFLQKVRAFTGKENGSIHRSDVYNIEILDISDSDIGNLKGIEYFTGLKEFYGYFNQFETLDFSHNKQLEVLDCSYNPDLVSINLLENAALKELHCQYAALETLDLTNNVGIETIECYSNLLSELDLSTNLELSELNCWGNCLSTLDVSNNGNISYIDCSYNNINSIEQIIGWQDKGLCLGSSFIFYPQIEE